MPNPKVNPCWPSSGHFNQSFRFLQVLRSSIEKLKRRWDRNRRRKRGRNLQVSLSQKGGYGFIWSSIQISSKLSTDQECPNSFEFNQVQARSAASERLLSIQSTESTLFFYDAIVLFTPSSSISEVSLDLEQSSFSPSPTSPRTARRMGMASHSTHLDICTSPTFPSLLYLIKAKVSISIGRDELSLRPMSIEGEDEREARLVRWWEGKWTLSLFDSRCRDSSEINFEHCK